MHSIFYDVDAMLIREIFIDDMPSPLTNFFDLAIIKFSVSEIDF